MRHLKNNANQIQNKQDYVPIIVAQLEYLPQTVLKTRLARPVTRLGYGWLITSIENH